VKSVASVFLSRIDTLVDKRLEALGGDALALRGKAGVALAKLAYRRYHAILKAEAASVAPGARPQFLLWASTGTKNAAYSDVMYVEPLIGPETINTLPDATLAAFRDHGRAGASLAEDAGAAQRQFAELERLGIAMNAVGDELQVEGVRLFEDAFAKLLQLAE
jgi:transaldolase